jgi:LysM repeat protein
MEVNCLASTSILAGQRIYLPAQAVVTPPPTATPVPPTPTTVACVVHPPPGWVLYTVQEGDNLYSLAQSRRTTVGEIQRVNCLDSYLLSLGQQIYLPTEPPTPTPTWTNVPTMTPSLPTPTELPTSTPTATLEPPTATPTIDPPTATPTATETATTDPGG